VPSDVIVPTAPVHHPDATHAHNTAPSLCRVRLVPQELSSAEFERVLHPVFEEDELTLILIGTALGGIAGAVQARV